MQPQLSSAGFSPFHSIACGETTHPLFPVVTHFGKVLTTTSLNFGQDRDFVFCIETEFRVENAESIRGHFLLFPDMVSLRAILDAIRLT